MFAVMLIANPMYDAAFKYLMDDDASARLLVGAVLDEEVESLQPLPQERAGKAQPAPAPGELLTVRRVDFAATARTASGDRLRVLVEVRKARFTDEVMRFREYLGRHYADRENYDPGPDGRRRHRPLRAIYILGVRFSLWRSGGRVFVSVGAGQGAQLALHFRHSVIYRVNLRLDPLQLLAVVAQGRVVGQLRRAKLHQALAVVAQLLAVVAQLLAVVAQLLAVVAQGRIVGQLRSTKLHQLLAVVAQLLAVVAQGRVVGQLRRAKLHQLLAVVAQGRVVGQLRSTELQQALAVVVLDALQLLAVIAQHAENLAQQLVLFGHDAASMPRSYHAVNPCSP